MRGEEIWTALKSEDDDETVRDRVASALFSMGEETKRNFFSLPCPFEDDARHAEMLKAGEDEMDHRDASLWDTPLARAVRRKFFETAKKLIEAGASPTDNGNDVTGTAQTPFDIAESFGQKEILEKAQKPKIASN